MAHRDDRGYYRSFQKYYRAKNFKVVRAAAWAVIAMIALIFVLALIVR